MWFNRNSIFCIINYIYNILSFSFSGRFSNSVHEYGKDLVQKTRKYYSIIKSIEKIKKKKGILKIKTNRISDLNKIILDKWFILNVKKSYISQLDLKELSIQTGLSKKRITTWIYNKRAIIKKNKVFYSNNIKTEAKIILREYFDNFSKNPDKEEITNLSVRTGIVRNKLVRWFANERHASYITDDGVDSDDDVEYNELNVIPRTSKELVQSLYRFVVKQEILRCDCNTKCKTKGCQCINRNK